MADNAFDPKIFEKQYLRAEKVPGLDFTQDWDRESLLSQVKELNKAHPPLLERKFTSLPKEQPLASTSTKNNASAKSCIKFRLMQWNMLAQGLSQGKDNFVRCPDAALDWNFRRLRLLEEVLETDPDVLCLQEVDHFGFFQPALKSVGYLGLFYPKPDSPALYVEKSNGPDGCAIFYKDKFQLVRKDTVRLRAYDSYTNQVSVVITLRPRGSPKSMHSHFTVATTHLKAKYGWEDLRQNQGSYLLKYLQETVGAGPLIVCGDLNADPGELVYEHFSSSQLGLQSVYKQLSKHKQEPPFTTWKFRGGRVREQEVCRTIDYIWFTKNSIQVDAVRLLPGGEDLGKDKLPAFCYPSDHLSLAADFSLMTASGK